MLVQATWDRLFEPPNFFTKYRHFIVLEASSACEEDQLQCVGPVESKVATCTCTCTCTCTILRCPGRSWKAGT